VRTLLLTTLLALLWLQLAGCPQASSAGAPDEVSGAENATDQSSGGAASGDSSAGDSSAGGDSSMGGDSGAGGAAPGSSGLAGRQSLAEWAETLAGGTLVNMADDPAVRITTGDPSVTPDESAGLSGGAGGIAEPIPDGARQFVRFVRGTRTETVRLADGDVDRDFDDSRLMDVVLGADGRVLRVRVPGYVFLPDVTHAVAPEMAAEYQGTARIGGQAGVEAEYVIALSPLAASQAENESSVEIGIKLRAVGGDLLVDGAGRHTVTVRRLPTATRIETVTEYTAIMSAAASQTELDTGERLSFESTFR